ncbi:hypothetical protein CBR_g45400 [Chara braunii]|uniref:ELMO domain-containing protein n=1 Tax=Chara braunii TaxID=69332 RepID=A0A388LYD4_CHABU|nr:hypothetical protein CBR_g45400 [Chara braunii]|eukprot:GBG87340.1 hypothetical protein CBR_g45400 [Chara braunii]
MDGTAERLDIHLSSTMSSIPSAVPLNDPVIVDESLKQRNRECATTVHWNVLEHCSGLLANLAAVTQGAFVFLRATIFSIFQPLLPGLAMLPEWSPLQKERFSKLLQRAAVQFDCSNIDHQTSLRALWKAAYPDRGLNGLVSDQWKDMGWQGRDPSTDFRGGGFISLENLLYFANEHPRQFRRIFNKETGKRADWEYPFAVAGLNVTFMLVELLGLRADSKVPTTRAAVHFTAYLEDEEEAFDELYCVAFQLLDSQWLEMGASYMEFNSVLRATRNQIEQALCVPKLPRIYDLMTILNLPQ